ncbi:MAG: PEP-CTERM sorting domain-containing protein [Rivularia sp. ALOHA_DT_140]|nr:PEP-CTERM sorting domain-containing protein [Rivularia sp. ALOHA_DT_140]
MTITIKKIRNYTLLGTLISASATAPAQAVSLKNVSNADDINNLQSQASAASKDINSQIEMVNKPDHCISFPESELCNQLTKEENQSSSNNPLFKKAKDIIKSVDAAKTTEVKVVKGRKHIVYHHEFSQQGSEELGTAIYSSASSIKEKVPEPSSLLGLIALLLLARKLKTTNNSQTLVEQFSE